MKDTEKFNIMLAFIAGAVLTWAIMSESKHIPKQDLGTTSVEVQLVEPKVIEPKVKDEVVIIPKEVVTIKEATKKHKSLYCLKREKTDPFDDETMIIYVKEKKLSKSGRAYLSYTYQPNSPASNSSSEDFVRTNMKEIPCSQVE